ncbi:GRAM domain-containing protein 2B-like isoform X1 [Hippoglossus hippoglossus]|uniref:GRAM domain-containing protein 2B-like isoform X1 n=2 Tax=Hippoglossus hippoglossus TaxID=8267 RepID=UPI00148CF4E9|nr:GRAM domain-containing protein 2B-like isoform X1 [Hippoglossus hippoglossus]XP_034470425.1 GRAM domain-containing protein 2B-like isoform X1 [Hippoglossus hippoglossus]
MSWNCCFFIMSLKSRRFSLDSSVSQNGGGLFGVKRSSGKKSRHSQSLDEARLEIQEFNHSLHSSMTIAEESQEGSHEIMNHKHNKSFHKLFPDIPEGENLTHVFTCALQKEVLYHGKLFVSKSHVCFYSSVLLKDTKVVIPTSSVREVKKQNSALSMLSIQTADGEKYSFVSLRNREMCYELLESLCSYAQQGESPNSSPRLSFAENPADHDVVSSYSSLDESVDRDLGRQNCIDYENFPEIASEGATRCSSTPHSMDKNKRAVSWIWSVVEKAASLVFLREMRNLSVFFYMYFMLIVMLLLASGYLSLKILALEEQLNSLGAQTELFLHHREYQET